MRVAIFIALASFMVAGCAGDLANADVARGKAAYQTLEVPVAKTEADRDYRIGAQDALTVSIFQEPELSTPPNMPLQVDASGNIAMPLIGKIPAAGKTASELSALIVEMLSAKYLVNPQVLVSVTSSVSQKVTVQGEVIQAGVYEIRGKTTLLEALALAKGESRVAALSQVLVYRNLEGQRTGALFDVMEIRKGKAADPEILGNDIVVVGYSKRKAVWRDVLSATPLLGVFRPF